MRKILLVLFFAAFSALASGQSMQINTVNTVTNNNGISVIIQSTSFSGANFLSSSYAITGNVIEIQLCYWVTVLAPVLTFTDTIDIPLENSGSYSINVNLVLSSSMEVCNNFANADNFLLQFNYLSSEQFLPDRLKIYPNPTSGVIYFTGLIGAPHKLEVFDISGKTVLAQSQLTEPKVDLTHFQDGIYLVKIQTDSGIINKKIVLRK